MDYIDSRKLVKARVLEFLMRYMDKGLLVLKTAYEISLENHGYKRPGDFDYRSLVIRLRSMGINYNPSNLLRILEKEYGIIERSYSTSTQKWFIFTDIDAVREALNEYMGLSIPEENPKIKALRIKYNSLDVENILKSLKNMYRKTRLNKYDKEFLEKLAFEYIDKIVELIDRMSEYESIFQKEISILHEIISLAEIVSLKTTSHYRIGREAYKELEENKVKAHTFIQKTRDDTFNNEGEY